MRRRSAFMRSLIDEPWLGSGIGCGSTGGHKAEVNMSEKNNRPRLFFKAIGIAFAAIVVLAPGGIAVAQDKYTLKVPGGLEFAEFRGYEGWQVVATSNSPSLKLVAV